MQSSRRSTVSPARSAICTRVVSALSPPELGALLAAQLEQHHDQPEVTQQMPTSPLLREMVGHRDGDRRPRAVVDEQVKDAHGRAARGVVDTLAPDDAGARERVEQLP